MMAWRDNKMKIYLFMRKDKNDKEGKEFYFLGEMYPTGEFKPIVPADPSSRVVEITYRLDCPVRHDLYEFIMSDLSESEMS